MTETDGANDRPAGTDKAVSHSRSRSRRRTVTDAGQTNHEKTPVNGDEEASASDHDHRGEHKPSTNGTPADRNHLAVPTITSDPPSPEDDPTDTRDVLLKSTSPNRPTAGDVAFPFKLSSHLVENGRNASTVTLESQAGVVSPKGDEVGKELGGGMNYGAEEVPKLNPIGNETSEHFEGTGPQKGKEEWRQQVQDEKIRRIGEDSDGYDDGDKVVTKVEERRGIIEDVGGLLHHVLVGNASGSSNGALGENMNGSEEEAKRPRIDRSDTASLD